MKKIVLSIMCLGIMLWLPISIHAATQNQVTVKGFRYTYKEIGNKSCWITKIEIVNPSGASVMKVPETLKGNKVTQIGWDIPTSKNYAGYIKSVFGTYWGEDGYAPKKAYKNTKLIKQVILPTSIEEIKDGCFLHVKNLEKINLPKKLKKLGISPFAQCDSLKRIKVPKSLITNAEVLCDRTWTKFEISKKNKKYKVKNGFLISKDGKKLYGEIKKMDNGLIPKGITKIQSGSLVQNSYKKVYIPETVTSIAKLTLDFKSETQFSVSSKNPYYACDKNCLYSKRSGRLVAATVKNGIVEISDKVTSLKLGTSFAGGKVKKMIIPKTVTMIQGDWSQERTTEAKVYCYTKTALIRNEFNYDFGWKLYVPKALYSTYIEFLRKDIQMNCLVVCKL